MRPTPALLFALALTSSACDLFEKPPSESDVVASDTVEACEPASALVPFFVDVVRDGESADSRASGPLFASGQAQVTYAGEATGSWAADGYAQELRLRFYDDPREVIVAVALPHGSPLLSATYGETLTAVVARTVELDDRNVYVALRDPGDNLRAWLVKGADGAFSAEAGFLCPFGFLCPTATLAEADCAPVAGECGVRDWPPVEIRPAGTGDPVSLRQGEVAVVTSGARSWTFFVSYASRLDESTCTDVPARALAAAILPGVAP